eukprot:GILI01013744.1.p1 GENE.GILI01013744.1~~GILI01013744.1.p1  ORF type:complete len:1049 (+),score=241.48 GILI01013744.1:470-3148(+)
MLLETNVSVDRMKNFLLRPDIEPYVETQPKELGIDLKDVTVTSRDKKTTILTNVSCSFPSSKLSLIHGPTGCGKSTLVKALIGEATVDTNTLGHVRVGGSLAYMAQEAWIMNATVRENIVMDSPFDSDRYWKVVKACQLLDDYKQLAHGDRTEIGERGVNLSGGQKQRIAFARAAYSDKDIIVMDDPLSAVDAHVCKRLFEDCILGFMRGRTRILVTHQTQFLNRSDQVVEMTDRAIIFAGPITDLKGIELAKDDPNEKNWDEGGEIEQHSAPLMEKERVVIGEVSWEVYGWFLRLGTLTLTFATLGLYSLWRASSVITDMWLTWWSNRGTPFNRTYTDTEYLQFFGITTAISIVFIYCRQMALAQFTVSVCKASHEAMVARLIRAPTSFFDTTPMGRILNRFTKDMDGLDVRIPDLVSQILMTTFNLLGMLILVAITTPFILILTPFLAFAIRVVYLQYSRTQRSVKQLESVSRSPVLAVVNETLGGLSTIRAFGMVEHFREKHDSRADKAARPAYNARAAQRWLSSRTEIIGTVILFFAAYIAALSRVTDASLGVSAKVMGLSLSYVISTTNAVTFLNRSFAEFEAEMNCTERIMEYSTQVKQEREVTYDESNPAPAADWGANGTISFQNVSLRYRENLPLVLKGVSFAIANRMKVGVVGRTGSGKSTIILTLFRMLELEGGSITIDGRDIAQTSLSDLRSRITIIPQDPVLFAGTLRSNLDPFDKYSDKDLWEALEKSNIKDRIQTDSKGLLCSVSEKGSNFSVGERQLLCMARAILRKCSILLLDEATASVDYQADQIIQDTIRTVFKDCTVITVAHRLSTIIDADKVVVMAEGQVLEDATPHELLQKEDGAFTGMVRQLGDEEFARLKEVAAMHFKAEPAGYLENKN